jgi:hypothetical protein
MKYPQYQIGAKWRVERDRNSFTFTIIAQGSKPGHKLCRVEWYVENFNHKNFESEYSHKHLKKYATYIVEAANETK